MRLKVKKLSQSLIKIIRLVTRVSHLQPIAGLKGLYCAFPKPLIVHYIYRYNNKLRLAH